MSNRSEKISLKALLSKYDKILIPDVQRDYVMGSGGDKLKDLFSSICDCFHVNKSFNFSCIMGYVDEKTNTFYVYDGQQRLVTLIYLCAYLYKGQDEDIKESLSKFEFSYRDEANKFLNRLLSKENIQVRIVDFTTFSLDNLLTQFKSSNKFYEYPYSSFEKAISFYFLYEQVQFELVIVDRASDAEQFFMDLNDGLDLKDYEIFKAELFHKAQQILKEKFKDFALVADNRWLNFFLPYKIKPCYNYGNKKEGLCEEEIEIAFIQYCFRMMWIEEKGSDKGYVKNSLDWITSEHINRLHNILNNITVLHLDKNSNNCINYTFGNRYRSNNYEIKKVEGVYWNLSDNDYDAMLYTFIKNICDFQYKDSVNRDVVIWAYISNLEKNKSELFKYLRFIKKLLNHNRVENHIAYFDINKTIWYTKYSAYGIPEYYIGNKVFPNIKTNESNLIYIHRVICLNSSFHEKFDINAFSTQERLLKQILDNEKAKYNSNQHKEIEKLENLPFINGIIDNLFNDIKEPIVVYDELLSKCEFKDRDLDYKDINKILGNIYSGCSNIENSFDRLIMKNLTIIWTAYTGNKCNEKGHLLPQTLTDLFTDIKFKGVVFDYILNEKSEEISCYESQLYLRGYRYFTKGWVEENLDFLCFPKMKSSGGFLSMNSSQDNYNYVYPIERICINDSIFDSAFLHIELSDNGTLVVKENGKIIPVNSISVIEKQKDWLTEKLIKNKYGRLYYCNKYYYSNIIIDEYIHNDKNKFIEIQKCYKDKDEIQYDIIRKSFNRCFFIDNSLLEKYLKSAVEPK